MALSADILQSIFQVTGISATVSAYAQVAQAALKMGAAQTKAAAAVNIGPVASGAAYAKSLAAYSSLATAASLAVIGLAAASVAAFAVVVTAVDGMVSQYQRLGTQILDLRDLTGASGTDAAKAVSLFGAAGINDATQLREILRLSKDLRTAQGTRGLAMLGIAPNPNKTGLQLFNEVIDKASQMQSGLRRTQAIEEIFGARSAAALLPLLRMTKEQRKEAESMGEVWSGPALQALQEFNAETGLLGQAFISHIVVPIAQLVLPALTKATKYLKQFLEALDSPLVKAGATFIIVTTGLTAIATLAIAAVPAITLLTAAFGRLATMQALSDALIPGGIAIIAGAAIAAAGVGYYASQAQAASGDGSVKANTAALQANTAALGQLTPFFTRLFGGKGAPTQLSNAGVIAQLESAQALGAIG